jgi:hypothetical protein
VVLDPPDEQIKVARVVEIEFDITSAIIRVPWHWPATTHNSKLGLNGHLKCPSSKQADDSLNFVVNSPATTPAMSNLFPLRMMDSTFGGSLVHIRLSGVNTFPESERVGQQSMRITVGETELLILEVKKDSVWPYELEIAARVPHFFQGGNALRVHFQDPLVT